MWTFLAKFAPVIIATGTTVGLFAIAIDDPKTKRIVRVIALLLGLGTVFSLVQQLPAVSSAMDDVARNWRESQRKAAEQNAAIEAAKTAAAAEALANQRRIDDARREVEIAAIKAKADADLARAKADAARAKAAADAAEELVRSQKRAADAEAQRKQDEISAAAALRLAQQKERDERVARARWEADQDAKRRAEIARREAYEDCLSQNRNPYMYKRDCSQLGR